MSQTYANLSLPANAPFKLQATPGKGWGVFATRFISDGVVILTERAYFIVHDVALGLTQRNREDVMKGFGSISASQVKEVTLLIKASDPRYEDYFDCFMSNSSTCANKTREKSTTWGFFVLSSRLNHSCQPNIVLAPNGDASLDICARRDIMPGEELTFCYNPDIMNQTKSQRDLICANLGFKCLCQLCQLDPLAQQISDGRRLLLRGIHFLTTGKDLTNTGAQWTQASEPITNVRLRKAAQQSAIPLTSDLFYFLMAMILYEAEGELSDAIEERIRRHIEFTIHNMQTARNIIKARPIIGFKHEDLWKCFGVAWELRGHGDDGDTRFWEFPGV